MGFRTRKFYKSLQTSFKLEWILFGLLFVSVNHIISNRLNFTPIQIKENLEIKGEGVLLDQKGALIEYGHSKKPMKEINEENISSFLGFKQLNFLHYKKWEQFEAINDQGQVHVNLIDLGYKTYIQIIAIMNGNQQQMQIIDTLQHQIFSNNQSQHYQLPSSSISFQGSYKYQSEQIQLNLEYLSNNQSGFSSAKISFNTTQFQGSLSFKKQANQEEFVSIKPLTKDHANFFYNVKTIGMEVNGDFYFSDPQQKSLHFNSKNSCGGRNSLKGVFNYYTYWFTASAQGKIQTEEGKLLNLGIYLGNNDIEDSLKIQDSIYLDGEIQILNNIKKNIDKQDLTIPWIFMTEEQKIAGSFKAQFQPLSTNDIQDEYIIIKIRVKQYFGYFSGYFINKRGEKVIFDKLQGYCLINQSRW